MNWKIISGIISILVIDALFSYAFLPPFAHHTLANRVATEEQAHAFNASRVSQNISFAPRLPTMSSVFQDDHSWIATLPADRIRIMTVTGDIIPARSVNNGVMSRNDPLWPYEKVVPVLRTKQSDITFINLESPLLPDCQRTIEGMIFCGNLRNIAGLSYLHVDVAGIANNHIGNYGIRGIESTENLLKNAGIIPTATSGAVLKNVRGKTFAFLAYNDIGGREQGVNHADADKIASQIADARKKADVVVVQFHWGTEYKSQPDPRQVELGHLSIDSGADIVIGNHPHWIQPIELYHGKLITYAHGNFIFDQMWSQKTREGVVGRYVFFDNQLIDVEYMPLQIDDYGQPHFVDGNQKSAILADMKNQSVYLSLHLPE